MSPKKRKDRCYGIVRAIVGWWSFEGDRWLVRVWERSLVCGLVGAIASWWSFEGRSLVSGIVEGDRFSGI